MPGTLLDGVRYLRREERESAPERVRLAAAAATVAALHVGGFGFALIGGAGQTVTVVAAVTAYLAGLRHGVANADHISGIDCATRKFVSDGRRPVSVGLAFSLGHSSFVALIAVAAIVGSGVAERLLVADNTTAAALGTIGSCIAGLFLLCIGSANLKVLCDAFHAPMDGINRTALGRVITKPLNRIRYPRQIFYIGAAMALGFDTASLIGLLVLTSASAVSGAGTVALLALPVCFAAGMTLGDTVNGVLMMRMYSSASATHDRRRGFNVAVTALSTTSALVIGTIMLTATIHDEFSTADPVTTWVAELRIDNVGYLLVGMSLALWAAFAARERWSTPA
jgi:nickel/cobalt transporter (NiCoT) family protein